MGKARDLSQFTVGQIQAFHASGMNQTEIAKKCKISRRSVGRYLAQDPETLHSARKNSGRKRCTTTRQDRILKNLVTRSPTRGSASLAQEVSCNHGCLVSPRTVRRRLTVDLGLPARRPAKKPLLTEKQRKARIAFCQCNQDKDATWWERVMFSDESTFQQLRDSGYNYIRRPPNQRYNPKYTIKTVKHPPSIMCWGAITAAGRAGLEPLPRGTRLNSAGYIRILESKVKVHMAIRGTTIFQQDSAPCHTSNATKRWFQQNEVQLLEDWPSNSPDLNVIENCWAVMKAKVAAHRPTSERDLQNVLKTVWTTEISPEYCKKLVHSMPQRIKAVLENKGYPIKY